MSQIPGDGTPMVPNSGAGSGASASVTYYISAAGSDANSGKSPATPWQTIAKVNATVPGFGSSFLFRGGDTFSGNIVVAAPGVTYSSYGDGNATINAGNGSAISGTDFGNITVTRLTLLGSGMSTNTGHGLNFQATKSNSGYIVQNLTISGFGLLGIQFQVTGQFVLDTITISGNTIHDCGVNGITLFNWYLQSTNYINYSNVIISGNLIYNITGQNTVAATQNFQGWGILCNGVDGLTIQNNTVHDCAAFANVPPGGSAGGAIGTALNSNVLIQGNELYFQHSAGGHDSGGIVADFGSTNTTIQYNFIHDCSSYGIGIGTITAGPASTVYNNINTIIRYNILLNNGTIAGLTLLPGGISVFSFTSGESILGLKVYNNTISAQSNTQSGFGFALFDDSYGHAGVQQGTIANNIFVGDSNTTLLNYHSDNLRFIGNQYVSGSNVVKFHYNGNPYTTAAAWIAATVAANAAQEAVDGASVLVSVADPTFVGTYPLQSLLGSPVAGTIAGRAANAQLRPATAIASAALDLSQLVLYQTVAPPLALSTPSSGVFTGADFDFKGGLYSGDVIGSISCSRAATSATDLLYTDPMGRAFNTFAANTRRITPGRGLLVEGTRQQFLATPGAPATQTTASIPNGTFLTLWVNGPGSATVTNGTGTTNPATVQTVAHGRPVAFSMASTGTLVVTVNGTLNQFQLENDPTSGGGVPSSFISALGTRDADILTCTSGAFFNNVKAFLQGNLGSASSGVQVFFTLPPLATFGNLIGEGNNVSYLGLEPNNNNNNTSNPVFDAVMSLGGSTLTRTGFIVSSGKRQAVGATTSVSGQAILANGSAAVTNAATNSPTITTVYIGNRQANDLPLGGYIERITASPFVVADLQYNTNINPIAADIAHDFWNNPVPGNNGGYAIGGHQPVAPTKGSTVTLNGATPVAVTDSAVTANSSILFTLKTVGGTVGAVPSIKTITPGSGFTVAGTAADTSVYNYMIIG